jgi:hypothetical protein
LILIVFDDLFIVCGWKFMWWFILLYEWLFAVGNFYLECYCLLLSDAISYCFVWVLPLKDFCRVCGLWIVYVFVGCKIIFHEGSWSLLSLIHAKVFTLFVVT